MPDVAQFMLERLREWGIERVFGYPGDGINSFLGGLEKADGPQFIQTRHEEMAAFMACSHAKFTGTIGACMATSGPGAVHLANGLYDAKLDHQPVIAIVGQQKRQSVGSHFQQEIDLQSFFKDVSGFCQHGDEPGLGPPRPGPRHQVGTDRTPAGSGDRARRRRLQRVLRPAVRARLDLHQPDLEPAARDPGRRAAAAGRRHPQLRREGGDPRRSGRSQGARRGHPDRRRARRRHRQGPARQGRRSRTTCPTSPAPSACSAPSPATRC